ncbi:Surfeit locus protein 6 [Orchesella cincta]|uniref:Surfeit locus protein 6 n=1 Tax=Orchesella cincta TaxID=48709 RepID=A0A1D2N911_ORCCI|nr:Surfeit locus protein 6 [Orchesella cincta]
MTNEGPPGFPGDPLSTHPSSVLRKTHNMKKFLTFPVHVLSRWDSEDFLYLLTLSTLFVLVVLHCFAVCFVEGFRITSKLSLGCHLASGCIILLLGISYIFHLKGKFVPYIKAAGGYSRFAHQYDQPLHLSPPAACLGLPVCYSAQDPPNTSPVTWTKLKREAITLEFIFRICAKHDHTRGSYLTDEEYQHSEMFQLSSITIRKRKYEYKDLKKLGFCQDHTAKLSSAVFCILFSGFCFVTSFLIASDAVDRTTGGANQCNEDESYFLGPGNKGQTHSPSKRMQRPIGVDSGQRKMPSSSFTPMSSYRADSFSTLIYKMESKFYPNNTPNRVFHEMSYYWNHFSKAILNLKLILALLMQALAVYAFLDQMTVYSRNEKWNRVLLGKAPILQNDDYHHEGGFVWNNKYIGFDDSLELKTILHRNLSIQLVFLSLLAGLIVFNVFNILHEIFICKGQLQHRDCNMKCLEVCAWISGALGLGLLAASMINIVFTRHYSTSLYGTAVMTLTRLISQDHSYVPRQLPKGSPISVMANAAFFLQIFNSCRHGSVNQWKTLNELNGATHVEIPSYQTLLDVGLCIDQRRCIPQIVLATMALINVFVLLLIIKLQKLKLGPPTISSASLKNDNNSMKFWLVKNFLRMCERPAANSAVAEDDEQLLLPKGMSPAEGSKTAGIKRKQDETPEEKKKRRKLERISRKIANLKAAGKLVATPNAPKKVLSVFNQVWDRESGFVTEVMQCLPELRNPGLFLEDEERTEEYLAKDDDAQDEAKQKVKTLKFFAKVKKRMESQGLEHTERATSYQELKERLHRKIAELAQKPNVVKREKKQKKKLKRKEEAKTNKGKKLISQTAAAAGGTGAEDSTVKQESSTEKTPLMKKPVVKSNGEIVYSKFDFISNEARNGVSSSAATSGKNKKTKVNLTAEELLKKAQKHESQISKLATQGKKSEAVSLAESQKWETALKRADGQKVRDDAYLLKKTIKKQEKQKQLTKKKWKERVEHVEQQKEQRQQKRQTNIESRRDDKKKRVKKLQRKRGRIA